MTEMYEMYCCFRTPSRWSAKMAKAYIEYACPSVNVIMFDTLVSISYFRDATDYYKEVVRRACDAVVQYYASYRDGVVGFEERDESGQRIFYLGPKKDVLLAQIRDCKEVLEQENAKMKLPEQALAEVH